MLLTCSYHTCLVNRIIRTLLIVSWLILTAINLVISTLIAWDRFIRRVNEGQK